MVLNFSRNIVTLSYDDKEDNNFLKVTRSLHRWRKTKNLHLTLSEINPFKKIIIFIYLFLRNLCNFYPFLYIDIKLIFFLFSGIQHYSTSNCKKRYEIKYLI